MNTITNETEPHSPHGQGPAKAGTKSWRGLAALAFLLAVGAVVGPRFFSNSPVHDPAAPAAPVVIVGQPLQKDIRGRLQLLGQFSAVDQVELRAQVGGTLMNIGFKDGAIVKTGDLLFEIDPTQYQIKLANATAQVERALKRKRRKLRLRKRARKSTQPERAFSLPRKS